MDGLSVFDFPKIVPEKEKNATLKVEVGKPLFVSYFPTGFANCQFANLDLQPRDPLMKKHVKFDSPKFQSFDSKSKTCRKGKSSRDLNVKISGKNGLTTSRLLGMWVYELLLFAMCCISTYTYVLDYVLLNR